MKHLASFGTLVGMLVGFAALQAPAANAIPSSGNSPESSCARTVHGITKYYGHDTVLTIKTRDGKEKKIRCNNGAWEPAMYTSNYSSTYAYYQ